MKIKKAKKRTTLTESWMEGIPEDNTYILSIVEARSELAGLNEETVREVDSRLNAAIKVWKLDHGASIADILNRGFHLTREVKPFHKSDLTILLENPDYGLFEGLAPHPQRIAIQLLKAAERNDTDTILKAKSELDLIRYNANEKDRQKNINFLIELIARRDKLKHKKLMNARHKRDREAKEFARNEFQAICAEDPTHDRPIKVFTYPIQQKLISTGFRSYSERKIWEWIKDLETSGVRTPGRKPLKKPTR